MSKDKLLWHKALEPNELAEGRVKSVSIRDRGLCLTHFRGERLRCEPCFDNPD